MPDDQTGLFQAPEAPVITDPAKLPTCRHGHREALPCPWCDGQGDCAYRSPATTPKPLCGTELLVPCPDCREGCVYHERSEALKAARKCGKWEDGTPFGADGPSVLDDPWDAWDEKPPPTAPEPELPEAPPPHTDDDVWIADEHQEPEEPPPPPAEPSSKVPLNERQAAAVAHLDGPALVIAGAGSGKTRVLTQRLLRLMDRRISPQAICAVTFTRKAASEMKKRIAEQSGYGARKLTISTFHSLALSICRDSPEEVNRRGGFSIWDDKLMTSEMRRVVKELWAADPLKNRGKAPPPGPLLTLIGRRKDAAEDPCDEDFLAWVALNVHPVAAAAIQEYEATKEAANALDYDDLIWSCVRLFERDRALLARYQDRWRYWLVDEYQDTNNLQERLLRLLVGEARNLMVVGDEDQSIYGFRGANVDHILTFTERYPGAVMIELGQNYRSRSRIVTAAAQLVQNNDLRRPKRIWTENPEGWKVEHLRFIDHFAEASYVARQIQGSIEAGYAPEDHAVLVRTRRQFNAVQAAMIRAEIPHTTVGALEMWQRADVKLVISWLKCVLNPRDFASGALCMANWPKLGATTVNVWQKAARRGSEPMFNYLAFLHGRRGCGKKTQRGKAITAFGETVKRLGQRFRASESIREMVTWLYEAIGLDAGIEEQIESATVAESEAGHSREALREQFLALCPEVTGLNAYESVGAFLDTMLLNAGRDRDAPKVRLSTIHSAKGLEWDHVWVVGLVEGLLPLLAEDSDIEEERRLAYVAFTRARQRLVLTRFDQRYNRHNKPEFPQPSRFLRESVSKQRLVRADTGGRTPLPDNAIDLLAVHRARAAAADRLRVLLQRKCAVCTETIVDPFGLQVGICPDCRRGTPVEDDPLAEPAVRAQARGLLQKCVDPEADAEVVDQCLDLLYELGYDELSGMLDEKLSPDAGSA